jgi:hypothetical protein
MKKKKYKMTFEVVCKFEDLIDEESFEEEYKGNLLKLCKYMCKEEGIMGWYDEDLKLVKAEFINK